MSSLKCYIQYQGKDSKRSITNSESVLLPRSFSFEERRVGKMINHCRVFLFA
ncbi:6101_t:CDS:2 [Funneliformis mosseae]|uniref:6101_t:CDS:1 n=1 Tax=Funneliformis mosseae TaxID=27381 RepID=A0A9N8YSV5_FUNMO|nr:6101_t:CDS:2 [Funneliformis mosseae]